MRMMIWTLGGVVCMAAPVAAQTVSTDAASGGPSAGGDIVVTAKTNNPISIGKTDERLLESPQSVSVVDKAFIEAINTKTVAESLSYTPGIVVFDNAFNRTSDTATIRGFNISSGNGGILLDGMKPQAAAYGGGIEPYGLERIEVLRGAASVLYGQVGPGGVINNVSKKPLFDWHGELRGQYGSFDRKEIAADIGGPIDSGGKLAFRLTGLWRDAGTEVRYTDDNRRFVAPALTWRPDARTELTLLASYQQIRTGFPTPLSPAMIYGTGLTGGPIPRRHFLGERDFDRYDANQWNVGYQFSHRFSDHIRIESALRYYEGTLDWDYLVARSITPAGLLVRRPSFRHEKTSTLSTDTRVKIDAVTGPLDHQIMVGLDIYRPTYDQIRLPLGTATALNVYDPVYGTPVVVNPASDIGFRQTSTQTGLYAQDRIKVAGGWTLVVGGREDWVKTRNTPNATGVTARTSDSAFTWRAAVVHVSDNGLAPYASYSRSFQPTAGADINGDRFKPTRGEQYEAGLRYQRPGSHLLVSGAVYQLSQTNVVTYSPDLAGYVQRGEIRVRGVELEAQARLARGLKGLLSYAYTMPKITKSENPQELGQRPSDIPKHLFSAWADYALDDIGLRGLSLGGGVRYKGGSSLISSTVRNRSYALVDAVVSYGIDRWRLSFNARNLLDKHYADCINDALACRYGDPRVLSGTLAYRF